MVLSQFHTQTTKCYKIPTLKVRESFANHYVFLFYFNVTRSRAPGSFLFLSAFEADDQPWTFK